MMEQYNWRLITTHQEKIDEYYQNILRQIEELNRQGKMPETTAMVIKYNYHLGTYNTMEYMFLEDDFKTAQSRYAVFLRLKELTGDYNGMFTMGDHILACIVFGGAEPKSNNTYYVGKRAFISLETHLSCKIRVYDVEIFPTKTERGELADGYKLVYNERLSQIPLSDEMHLWTHILRNHNNRN